MMSMLQPQTHLSNENLKTKHNNSNKPKKPTAVEKPNEPNNLLLHVIPKIIHSQLVVIN